MCGQTKCTAPDQNRQTAQRPSASKRSVACSMCTDARRCTVPLYFPLCLSELIFAKRDTHCRNGKTASQFACLCASAHNLFKSFEPLFVDCARQQRERELTLSTKRIRAACCIASAQQSIRTSCSRKVWAGWGQGKASQKPLQTGSDLWMAHRVRRESGDVPESRLTRAESGEGESHAGASARNGKQEAEKPAKRPR